MDVSKFINNCTVLLRTIQERKFSHSSMSFISHSAVYDLRLWHFDSISEMDHRPDKIVSPLFLSNCKITVPRNLKRPMLLATNLSGVEFGSTNKTFAYISHNAWAFYKTASIFLLINCNSLYAE